MIKQRTDCQIAVLYTSHVPEVLKYFLEDSRSTRRYRIKIRMKESLLNSLRPNDYKFVTEELAVFEREKLNYPYNAVSKLFPTPASRIC